MATEENAVEQQPNSANKQKRIVERSASYPGINLEDALSFTNDVHKSFPSAQIINRDDIAAVLGKVVGTIQRDIAAATQFGIFTKTQKEGYKINSWYKDYRNAFDDKERKKFLLTAFASPKLYSELIEKFDGHAIPAELKTHLIRFHKIAEKAAPFAAQVFIESAKYCGVLNENNILVYKQEASKISDPNFQYAEVISETKNNGSEVKDEKNGQVIDITPKGDQNNNQLMLPTPTEEKLKVHLTRKQFAYIVYPSNINQKDIDIIKKQIEVLELLVT